MDRSTTFIGCAPTRPCRICDGVDDGCRIGADGLLMCRRAQAGKGEQRGGFVCLGPANGDGQWLLWRDESDQRAGHHGTNSQTGNGSSPEPAVDWEAKARELSLGLTDDHHHELADTLGIPGSAIHYIGHVGWVVRGPHKDPVTKLSLGPCWTFPEIDGAGICGIGCRYADGAKKAWPGGRRGIVEQLDWRERPGPIVLAEGASDVLAGTAMGLAILGRPSNCGGVEILAEMLEGVDRDIIVLGENDSKPDGTWPGRKGAIETAEKLTLKLKRLVKWALPPDGAKDMRAWLKAQPKVSITKLSSLGEKFLAGLKLQNPADTKAAAETVAPSAEPPPPTPPTQEAYYGLPGEIVRAIEPATEADNVAILTQLLIGFGNALGRTAHFRAENDQHFLNEYVVLVGRTAKARKGSSWGQVKRFLDEADMQWLSERVQSGASSAEGILWTIRDPIFTREKAKRDRGSPIEYVDVQSDPGVSDKRLLLFEAEFANVLKQAERSGNTLTALLRVAWERSDLQALTKNSKAKATGAHISLVGHITGDELRRYLTATELANGFGNRHCFVYVTRSKVLPEGGHIDGQLLAGLKARVLEALQFGRLVGTMTRNTEARAIWAEVYEELSEGKPGMAGALLGRAEAHVMRLACLYAILDQCHEVCGPHLKAALALWGYMERSVAYVFGGAVGDPLADDIHRMLKTAASAGMTRSEIYTALGRHRTSEEIGRAIEVLRAGGKARFTAEKTTGRAAERWFAI